MKFREQRPEIARALDRGVTLVFSILGKVVSRPQTSAPEKSSRSKTAVNKYDVAITSARDAYDNGQLGEALHLFAAVIELSPHEPWGWHGRGDCLQLTGEYVDALSAYQKAVEFGGGAYSHFGLGNAHYGLGNIDSAKEAWEEALNLDPSLEIAKRALSRDA